MDSDESHFNVSLFVRDKFTRQCPGTTFFEEKGEEEEKGEPKRIRSEIRSAYQPNALPLGQTGSLHGQLSVLTLIAVSTLVLPQ